MIKLCTCGRKLREMSSDSGGGGGRGDIIRKCCYNHNHDKLSTAILYLTYN